MWKTDDPSIIYVSASVSRLMKMQLLCLKYSVEIRKVRSIPETELKFYHTEILDGVGK
jgi:hypothetical protein